MENLIKQEKIKWYNQNNLRLLIFVTLIILILMNAIFLGTNLYVKNYNERLAQTDFYVNVNDVSAVCENEQLTFMLYPENEVKYQVKSTEYEVLNEQNKKTVYIKIVGKYAPDGIGRWYVGIELDENLDKIYLEDLKGNTKEVWNKSEGSLVERRYTTNENFSAK